MSDAEIDLSNGDILNNCDKMYSREEVIKCPHMMALLGYLNRRHKIPKYGWKDDSIRYHYTDAAGLLGIIQSGRLWATDLRFLNDPSERLFLPERLLTLMASKAGGSSATEQKIIQGIKEALLNPRSVPATFCVSLSANGDLLSQWRGYGGFGQGYAVGLKLGGQQPHMQLAHYYDIVYGEEGLADLGADLLNLFVSAADKWRDIMYDEWASTLSVIAKSFKHQIYSEEQESRLVCSRAEDINILFDHELPLNFRSKGGDLIPYIPMSLNILEDDSKPRLPIERIIIGPGVDFKRNCASVKSLLKAHLYDDVKIEPSIIPFRR